LSQLRTSLNQPKVSDLSVNNSDRTSQVQVNDRFPILWLILLCSLILFGCSSLKHILFKSTAWDLGIFDQAVFLISQGQAPISSFTNFHILGDHGALILYPLSLLYQIFPSVYWLLLVQAIALSVSIYPLYSLALERSLAVSRAWVIVVIYFCYPLVFNLNLFDFHPEVIALPAICWAIFFGLKQEQNRKTIFGFILTILVALSCKAAIALTVIGLGVWLFCFEAHSRSTKTLAALAIGLGLAWFLIITQVLIPTIGGEGANVSRHLSRYSYLGNSFGEIARNALLQPELILGRVFSLGTLEYFALMLSPLIWRISPRQFAPLVAAAPALGMNLLSSDGAQRDLIHQYSLPILPFLMVIVIFSLSADYGWKRMASNRAIAIWAIFGFLILSRLHFFAGNYWTSWDTLAATREAVSLIKNQPGSILTSAEIAPHLTHRPLVKLAIKDPVPQNLLEFDYVLLNLRHPGWLSDRAFCEDLIQQLKDSQKFAIKLQRDDVFLLKQQSVL
jgi:uncharacterized membrane protein